GILVSCFATRVSAECRTDAGQEPAGLRCCLVDPAGHATRDAGGGDCFPGQVVENTPPPRSGAVWPLGHRYRDVRLLICFAHPGLKSWSGRRPPRFDSEPLDADSACA